jgi:hypothetical protein
MGTVSQMLQEPEEAGERRFWDTVVRVLWTLLIILLVLGLLASLTAILGWRRYLLLSVFGLLAGASLSLAFSGSAHSRELTSLVLGAVTFPFLAVYVGAVAARDDAALGAYSASLVPFLAHALGAVLGGVGVARLWSDRPSPKGAAP